MRRIMFAAAVVAALSCGSSPMMMMDVPVKHQPLAGKINGVPFSAVSGTAKASEVFDSDGGQKAISIYETQSNCGSFGLQGDRGILTQVPWQVASYNLQLGGSRNVTLFYRSDAGDSENEIVIDGRIELVEAPMADAGVTALLRIRADANENFDVEGEIPIQVCD